MGFIAYKRDTVNLVIEALKKLELEPEVIPHGRIDELRGGISCINLKSGKDLDAAILLSKFKHNRSPLARSRTLLRVDYAIRGTIKGVLSGRTLSRTILETEGYLRKNLVGVKWETPMYDPKKDPRNMGVRTEGQAPEQGELWEGGPHQTLAERLNNDRKLMDSIETFMKSKIGSSVCLSVSSDERGESIRIRGGIWVRTDILLKLYTTPRYLKIASTIGQHIKELRKSFGGLSF
jgi:hypothetical protein